MKLTLQNLQNNVTADFTSRGKEGKKNRYEIFLATFFTFIFLEKKCCRIVALVSAHSISVQSKSKLRQAKTTTVQSTNIQ